MENKIYSIGVILKHIFNCGQVSTSFGLITDDNFELVSFDSHEKAIKFRNYIQQDFKTGGSNLVLLDDLGEDLITISYEVLKNSIITLRIVCKDNDEQ